MVALFGWEWLQCLLRLYTVWLFGCGILCFRIAVDWWLVFYGLVFDIACLGSCLICYLVNSVAYLWFLLRDIVCCLKVVVRELLFLFWVVVWGCVFVVVVLCSCLLCVCDLLIWFCTVLFWLCWFIVWLVVCLYFGFWRFDDLVMFDLRWVVWITMLTVWLLFGYVRVVFRFAYLVTRVWLLFAVLYWLCVWVWVVVVIGFIWICLFVLTCGFVLIDCYDYICWLCYYFVSGGCTSLLFV